MLECSKSCPFMWGILTPSPNRHVYGPLRAYARFGTRSSQVSPGSHWGHRPVPEALRVHLPDTPVISPGIPVAPGSWNTGVTQVNYQ